MDTKKFFLEFQDYLAPRLDTYEQAIYLYIVRHSRLIDEENVVIGFKSARKNFAFGVGQNGTPMSEGVIYKKLDSLKFKKIIEILNSEYKGTRVKAFLPSEIEGIIELKNDEISIDLENIDFYSDEYREYILKREDYQCFYCHKKLDNNNYVIEHVVSRPEGNNSYKNLVASCRSCNNKKSEKNVEEFIRNLYRENFISDIEFEVVNNNLKLLKNGELKPNIRM